MSREEALAAAEDRGQVCFPHTPKSNPSTHICGPNRTEIVIVFNQSCSVCRKCSCLWMGAVALVLEATLLCTRFAEPTPQSAAASAPFMAATRLFSEALVPFALTAVMFTGAGPCDGEPGREPAGVQDHQLRQAQ
eukprot:3413688-Rhodomonas_salina.1